MPCTPHGGFLDKNKRRGFYAQKDYCSPCCSHVVALRRLRTEPLNLGTELYIKIATAEGVVTAADRQSSDYKPTSVTIAPPTKMGGVKFETEVSEESGDILYIPTKDTDAADALAVISYLTDNYGEPYNYNETYIWANDDDSFKIVLAVWDAADIQRGLAICVTGA